MLGEGYEKDPKEILKWILMRKRLPKVYTIRKYNCGHLQKSRYNSEECEETEDFSVRFIMCQFYVL